MTRALLLCAVLASSGCDGSRFGSETPTGTLAGTIAIGPFCPVEIEGEPCPPPPGTFEAVRVLVYARAGGRLVADGRPDAEGRFELRLPAGAYRVVLEHPYGLPGGPDAVREARVEPGAVTTLAFDIDTGIR